MSAFSANLTVFRHCAAGLLLFSVWLGTASAEILRVPQDYATITGACNAATTNTEIQIATGIYNEAAAITIAYPGIKLVGKGSVVIHSPTGELAGIIVDHYIRDVEFTSLTLERPTGPASYTRNLVLGTNSSAVLRDCKIRGPGSGVGVMLNFASDLAAYNTDFTDFNPEAAWAGAITFEGGGWDPTWYSDVTLEDCTFINCNRWLAVSTFASTGNEAWAGYDIGAITVRRCDFGAPIYHASAPANAPIYLRGADLKVRYDPERKDILFEDCNFAGRDFALSEIHYPADGTYPQSFTMRRCKIDTYDSHNTILYYDLPSTTTFENVLIAGGKHEQLVTFGGAAQNVRFLHCTLVNDGILGAESAWGADASGLIVGYANPGIYYFRNCILQSSQNYSAAITCPNGPSSMVLDLDYTILNHGTPFGLNVTPVLGDDYSTASPQFVSLATHDLQLTSGSPAVNAGINLNIDYDLLGTPRLRGPAPDLGVYESSYGVVPTGAAHWELY